MQNFRYLCKNRGLMTMNSINVRIPKSDMPFFRKLSRKMGWVYSDNTFEATDCDAYREAMEDVEAGRVYHAESVEDMFTQILG